MPHVNRNEDGRYWVVDSKRKQAISLPEMNHKVTEWDWINWMVAEAEKTEEDKNIEKYQWLTDYDIPATVRIRKENPVKKGSLVSVNSKKR